MWLVSEFGVVVVYSFEKMASSLHHMGALLVQLHRHTIGDRFSPFDGDQVFSPQI